MGVYPTGTWVEMLDGSVGIVCSQDSRSPLAPRIAVMQDSSGKDVPPHVMQASRMNPIICAHKPGEVPTPAPDLEAIA